MIYPHEQWRFLRNKADETTDDPDWVATNDPEAGSIDFTDADAEFPAGTHSNGRPYTGIECVVVGVTDAGAVQDRSSMQVTMQLLQRIDRSSPQLNGGRAATLEPLLVESTAIADVPLHRLTYWPMNGGRFAMRITADSGDSADNLEVWWRAVSR